MPPSDTVNHLVTYSSEVTLGTIIQIGTFVVLMFAFYTRIMRQMVEMETKVDTLWNEFMRRMNAINGMRRRDVHDPHD